MCSNTTRKTPIIKCPNCGAQFLPGEIYMPGAFIGKPEDIVKDSLGKILYEDYPEGGEPNMLESYICDYCNKPFIIEATVTYKTSEETPEKDFSQQYVSLID
jgi:DNA-directed RNA polymerase subunit RPC12/RpoP